MAVTPNEHHAHDAQAHISQTRITIYTIHPFRRSRKF